MSKPTVSQKKTTALTRARSGLMALEPRFMFDGAAVADAVQVVADTTLSGDAKVPVPAALAQAEQLARQKTAEFVAKASDQELFNLFNGGRQSADAAWAERLSHIRDLLNQGELPVNWSMMDQASQFTAVAAFTANGPDGQPTIFVNPYWLNLLDDQDVANVLVEELGHWMDSVLNPDSDTPDDEGERFASAVLAQVGGTANSVHDESGWVVVNGERYAVEFASFNFVNSYRMVYDLDNDTLGKTTAQITTADIDVNERWADKEQNLHYFDASTPLGVVLISDGTSNQNFSGNDVSATSIVIGDRTYYGWISRPIKANGVVRGFYFWTDNDFANLTDAQNDGNQDGDSTVIDNRGFLLVVDQSWFTSQITSTGSSRAINNTKDGNLGTINVASVGSSSDRVDSALNSLLVPNAVNAVADSAIVLEDSGANTGNLLTNDSDPNGDNFTVTAFSVGGTPFAPGSTPRTIAGVGTIAITSTGAYTFTPVAGYSGPVPVISYTITDVYGATSTSTLSLTVTRVNDAPAGTDKSITTRENTAYALTAADFGFTDPSDAPPNNFASVVITTLPTAGTLLLNGTPVTAGQEILVSALAGLRFQPASNANGNGYASLTFQVRDDGGTANGGVNLDGSPNTLTFNVQSVNSAPTAASDTATIGEAGGVNNATDPTPTVTGNVLTNDTDTDAGDSKTVTAVVGVNTGTVGSSVAGKFGSLLLNSNGGYTYTVDNNNPMVQALRLVTNTLSDVFTYTVSDGGGLTSTTTLTVTITGANDFPVAQDDYDAVKEGATATSGVWGSTTGSVLPNDSDVDGGTLVVGSVSTTIGNVDVLTVTSPIASATYTVQDVSLSGNWTSGIDNNASAQQNVLLNGSTIQRSDGAGLLKVYRTGSGGSAALVFNHPATLYAYDRNTTFGVSGSPNTLFKITAITPTVNSSTTLDVTAGDISSIAVGDTVSGTGITAGTLVTAINTTTKQVTLSQAAQITSRDISFTGTGTSTSTQSITSGSSTTLTGNYGNLVLASSGSYTYNLTSDSLNDGQTATESFTYTVNDSAGGTDTAVLYIRIDGRSSVAVAAADDSFSVNEDATLSVNSTSGVLANDTASSTVSSYTWGGVTTAIGSAVTYPDVGTLTLNANGSFTFVPVANFSGTVPAVVYTIANGAGRASAVLTITVNAVNDGPTAVADTTDAREAGGYGNDLPGHNPSGNLLNNDTDPEGNALSITAFSHSLGGGTLGQARAGTYGSLTLNTDGSYSYVVNNDNAAVQALASGQTVTDVFNYTTSDGSATSSSTLTVTVRGANDAPVNAVPGSVIDANMGTSTAITGVSVSDVDNDTLTVTLSVAHGTLNIGTTGLTFTSGANGQSAFTVTGTKANLNAALANLSYTPGVNFVSADTLSIQTTDAGALQDNDTVAIRIVDNRALSVTGTRVNEASPFVLFRVSGAAGQSATLALGNTAINSDADATQGADFLPNLQYFDGTNWQNYTGQPVPLPAGGVLLVRTPVLQDSNYEGEETLTLTATNQAGTASTPATSTIVDDGTGAIFLGNNNTFTANNPGDTDPAGPDYPGYLDDDRPLSINSIVVNEASPYAVFSVSGVAGQKLSLTLVDGTAVVGTDTASAPTLEIFNGSSWVGYSAGSVLTLSGSSLQVRLALTQDTTFEQGETFFLGVTQMGNGATVYGKATILDDGNGSKFVFDNDNNPANDPQTPTETSGPGVGFDDDRPLSITAFGPVNEASTYAMFTVNAADGYVLDLSLQGTAAVGDAEASFAGFTLIEYSTDGTNWSTYSGVSKPVVPASGQVYVRVTITSENELAYEGSEGFALKAAYASNTAKTATGETSIVDDGTGKKYGPDMTGGVPSESILDLDDDRDPAVSSPIVNEGSPYMVFAVSSRTGVTVTLSLATTGVGTGHALLGTDVINSLQVFSGGQWSPYVANSTVTIAQGGEVLVRLPVQQDDLFESRETLKLIATNNNLGQEGTGTIVDDGTGAKYVFDNDNDPTPTVTTGPAAGFDDDRILSVASFGPVNEASTYAMFTVNATEGYKLDLALQNATEGTAATWSGFTILEYSTNGTDWTAYTWNGSTGNQPTVPSGGQVFVRVNITPELDATYEGAETFALKASYSSNPFKSAAASTSIVDDGSGKKWGPNMPGGTPAESTVNLDDDRPSFSINDVTVNEAAGTITFTVTKTGATALASSTQYAFADGTALGGAGKDFTGTPGTLSFAPNEATKTITVTVNNDSVYEGAESFTVNLSNASGATITDAQAVGTIKDDGTGGDDDSDNTDNAGDAAKNDDRPTLTVTGKDDVSEGSPSVFDVQLSNAYATAQTITLTLGDTSTEPGDYSTAMVVTYTDPGNNQVVTVNVNSGGTFSLPALVTSFKVRVATTVDGVYEGPETFSLTAAVSSGPSGSDTSTVLDDGSGRVYNNDGTADTSAVPDDDRPTLTVTGKDDVSEGSPSVFDVQLSSAYPTAQTITLTLGDTSTEPGDYSTAMVVTYTDPGNNQVVTVNVNSGGTFSLPALVTSFKVRVATTVDGVYEGPETFSLTAAVSSGPSGSDTSTVLDDGSGRVYNNDGTADTSAVPDDDRPTLTVTGKDDVSEGSPSVFDVQLSSAYATAQTITLTLGNVSSQSPDYGAAMVVTYTDPSNNQVVTVNVNSGGTFTLPALVTGFKVRVMTTADSGFEGAETFSLTAAVTGGQSASDTSRILDDGTGTVYDDNGQPTDATSDDDRPKPAAPLPPPAPIPVIPAAPVAELPPPPPRAVPPQSFSSALSPLVPTLVPAEPPRSLVDAITSSSGYQIPVSETAVPGLSLYQGITDQVVRSTNVTTRVSMPMDAFIHSNKDAVIKLDAKQANDAPLPSWVQFDAEAGVFIVTPPAGFKGKLDLKVVARDDDGREAVAIFQMFVGEEAPVRPQSREGFTEKLRMAGKRPITLVRAGDVSHKVVVRDAQVVKARMG